jgi:hypothetical protein
MQNPSLNHWYIVGRREARTNAFPLYAVLIAAGESTAARQYAEGWKDVSGGQLSSWTASQGPFGS